ncbi:hypothetical protein PIB30_005924 [Stylosanthes scabra]|uniref:Uncharacterized protein n=1 Tax=Stylosanthes scabra TaxID=79078 RepID=A0ABU6R314_9FABA|nr:hypothetical protein [Stylosanthes scabra]
MAENTRLKTLEAELMKFGQRIEEVSDESQAEHARATEAMSLKFDVIQSSLTQIIQEQSRSHSPSMGFSHGSNSRSGWIFSMDQYFEYFRVPEEEQIEIAAIHMSGSAIP